MMLPFVWLARFQAEAIMLAGTGLTLLAVMHSEGRIINLAGAFAACSVASR